MGIITPERTITQTPAEPTDVQEPAADEAAEVAYQASVTTAQASECWWEYGESVDGTWAVVFCRWTTREWDTNVTNWREVLHGYYATREQARAAATALNTGQPEPEAAS